MFCRAYRHSPSSDRLTCAAHPPHANNTGAADHEWHTDVRFLSFNSLREGDRSFARGDRGSESPFLLRRVSLSAVVFPLQGRLGHAETLYVHTSRTSERMKDLGAPAVDQPGFGEAIGRRSVEPGAAAEYVEIVDGQAEQRGEGTRAKRTRLTALGTKDGTAA